MLLSREFFLTSALYEVIVGGISLYGHFLQVECTYAHVYTTDQKFYNTPIFLFFLN